MSYLAELWVSPNRDRIQMVFDHTPIATPPVLFAGEGPEDSGAYAGFFETPDSALSDAYRIIGSIVAFSQERKGDYTIYRAPFPTE